MNRIKNKDIEYYTKGLNILTKSPLEEWDRIEGKLVSNIGYFYYQEGSKINGQMHKIERIATEGGGCSIILSAWTKRELYDQVKAYYQGLNQGLLLK
tara:strand:- start:103 stop:393 length:291 start_codon:yes stop_codon:yes gene_type:complete